MPAAGLGEEPGAGEGRQVGILEQGTISQAAVP